MLIHEVFAQIHNGEVKNIIVCANYATADHLAKLVFGEDAFSVDCLQYPCGIGHKYHDGRFWSVDESGVEIALEYIPTERQKIDNLTLENEELTLVMAEMIGGGV